MNDSDASGLIVMLIVWSLFALVGYAIGNGRGRGTFGTVMGFLLGPIGWLITICLPNLKEQAERKTLESKLERVQNIEALAKLAELKEKGVITEAEFQSKKRELFG